MVIFASFASFASHFYLLLQVQSSLQRMAIIILILQTTNLNNFFEEDLNKSQVLQPRVSSLSDDSLALGFALNSESVVAIGIFLHISRT